MAIEIVEFPTKKGDFPQICVGLPQGNQNHPHLTGLKALNIWNDILW